MNYWHYVEDKLNLEEQFTELKEKFIVDILYDLFGEKDEYLLEVDEQAQMYKIINVIWKDDKIADILKGSKIYYKYDDKGRLFIKLI